MFFWRRRKYQFLNYYSDEKKMSITDTLLKDLLTSHSEAIILHGSLAKLDADLGKLHNALQEPQSVAADIDKVDNLIKDVNEILTVVEIIPPITEEVNTLKNELSNMDKVISDVRTPADKIAKACKSAQGKIDSFRKQIVRVETQVANLAAKAQVSHDDIKKVYDCMVNKKIETCALDEFSAKVDPLVEGMNTALGRVNGAISSVGKEIESFEMEAASLAPTINALNEIEAILKPIQSALVPVEKALAHKFNVNLLVTHFSFSVKQILDGINTGISWVNAQFMKLVDIFLNPILKALHLNVKLPSIPGLNIIKDLNLGWLGPLSSLMTKLESLENQMEAVIEAIESFDITCN